MMSACRPPEAQVWVLGKTIVTMTITTIVYVLPSNKLLICAILIVTALYTDDRRNRHCTMAAVKLRLSALHTLERSERSLIVLMYCWLISVLCFRRLVPAFCARYLGAGAAGVRRACLSLVRKMVHYAPARLLREMSCAREPHTAALLTQLVAAVLDNVVRSITPSIVVLVANLGKWSVGISIVGGLRINR